MTNFAQPVGTYMSSPANWIAATASLREAADRLAKLHHTSLPVIAGDELVGVISYTDLLRVGKAQAGNRPHDRHLVVPDRPVSEVMTRGAICVSPGASLRTAATTMLEARVHRVYVAARGALSGVLSTYDLMLAIRDLRWNHPVSELMSAPVFTVRSSEPISLATERLERAHVSGLVVVDENEWAIGTYAQSDALRAADQPRDTPIEEAMNFRLLVVPARTPTYRAAAQAAATRARRVVATNREEIVGILSGLDFARAVAS
jgi:CBS domain-containing protein